MRGIFVASGLLALTVGAGCADEATTDESTQALSPALQAGRDTWFKSTFGGEKFFTDIVTQPPFNLHLGLDVALTSPRATRFTSFGLINDPDCVQGDATTGYLDKCTDPQSAGVVGVRKFITIENGAPKVRIGVSCAACHAGLDAENPPANPNAPTWDNIHPTIGNQYIQIGKLFAAHLTPNDPRYQVFNTWAPGTVDTTAIESDGINNPGIITQFWNVPDRPFFDLHDRGTAIRVHRGGQGGEDDVGCEKAALRVYFNIGMCAAECMVPKLVAGGEIDDAQCSAACPEYNQAKAAVVDMCSFMASATSPKLPNRYIDKKVVNRGKKVFDFACSSCHSNGKAPAHDVLSDDEVLPAAIVGTNSCRSKSTNWMAGRIWGQFSSDEYKARPTGGPGYYRNVPLNGVWATAPFFHNNRLGKYNGDPSISGRLAAYDDAMNLLLNPLRRNYLGSIQTTTAPISVAGLTLPKGTPVALFANLDQATLQNRCPDLLENQGHYFGATLSSSDKYALKEYLKTK